MEDIQVADRYTSRTARNAARKSLETNCSLIGLYNLLGCSLNNIKPYLRQLQSDAYVEALPKGISLCWGCMHGSNKYGECSWSRDLKPREDWDADSITVRKDKIEGKLICVRKCKGFRLTQTKLERKYIIAILSKFYSHFSKDLFTVKFFTKCDNPLLQEWLNLYNNYIDLVNLPPLTLVANESWDYNLDDDSSKMIF